MLRLARALSFVVVLVSMLMGYGVSAFVAVPLGLFLGFGVSLLFGKSDNIANARGVLRHINDLKG